jgi:hypothetical protein
MKVISTTEARKTFANIVESVKAHEGAIAIGRRDRAEVLLIPYPQHLSARVTEITNVNANSTSFDFLSDEPDMYTIADLKKQYD